LNFLGGPPKLKPNEGGELLKPIQNGGGEPDDGRPQPPGLTPEVLYGPKLDVDREPLTLSPGIIVAGHENQDTARIGASDDGRVTSSPAAHFRHGSLTTPTYKETEKEHFSSPNISRASKNSRHSLSEASSASAEEENSLRKLVTDDRARAIVDLQKKKTARTTIAIVDDKRASVSPLLAGNSDSTIRQMELGGAEKSEVLSDEISLKEAQNPDSTVFDEQDVKASHLVTAPTLGQMSKILHKKKEMTTSHVMPIPSSTPMQSTIRNSIEIADETDHKRTPPHPKRPIQWATSRSDYEEQSAELGDRMAEDLMNSEAQTSLKQKQRHSGAVTFEKVLQEEDTEKALAMLLDQMSAVAEREADESEVKTTTPIADSSKLHSGEIVHIRVKSRETVGENFGAATAEVTRKDLEELKAVVKQMESKLSSMGERKPTAEERAINLNLVPQAPPTSPHPTDPPTVIDPSGLRVLAGTENSGPICFTPKIARTHALLCLVEKSLLFVVHDRWYCVAAAQWSEWSEWGECFCEKELRTRFCKYDESSLTKGCAGKSFESRACLGGTPCPTTTAAPVPPSHEILEYTPSTPKGPRNGYAFRPSPLSLAIKTMKGRPVLPFI
uniref:FHA domain-containing protein n=1 Tax=Toxocara canis TaxID=6265 RepID=A0A183UII1_TOXCA